MYKFKGNVPVKRRDRVDLLDIDGQVYETCCVYDTLATQFTVLKKGRTRFFFYADKGINWRFSDDNG